MYPFYYLTSASGDEFIKKYTQYALKSLLKTGVDPEHVYCTVNLKSEAALVKELVPDIKNVQVITVDYEHVKWSYLGGRRRHTYFKAEANYRTFPDPLDPGRYLIHFDGDVLWFKNPTEFFLTKKEKTWFHHGKDLQKRCKNSKHKINPRNYESLSKWVDEALAWLLIQHEVTDLPDREVVSGLYLLHPRDHKLLYVTNKYVKEIARKFKYGKGKDSAGEQKPMNAALCKLGVDWHGGSKFYCPEYIEYFEHYFGKEDMKRKFFKKVKELDL